MTNVKRCDRISDAHAEAWRMSKEFGLAVVIQSPVRGEPEIGEWVAEAGDGGMLRSWERLIAMYKNGKRTQSGPAGRERPHG